VTKADVAIIDSGGANIASLARALERLGAHSVCTADRDVIANASHVVLPGVGAAGDAMQKLRLHGLTNAISALQQPVLGICLGMHLLAQHSEEDDTDCLGILETGAIGLDESPGLPVPNIGWCPVTQLIDHPLLHGIATGSYFYFVHSYALPTGRFTVATTTHSSRITAIAAHGNFFATQFHPERSASAGSRLLANFLAMH
jgi:glutamine amidotransferase